MTAAQARWLLVVHLCYYTGWVPVGGAFLSISGKHTPTSGLGHQKFSGPRSTPWRKFDEVDRDKGSDVYEVAMVVYEASSHCLGIIQPENQNLDLLGLDEEDPYFKWNDTRTLEKIRIGELPQKPSGIDEAVWEFLQNAGAGTLPKRHQPPIVHSAFFANSVPFPKFTLTLKSSGYRVTWKAEVADSERQSWVRKSRQHRFCVKLKSEQGTTRTRWLKFSESFGLNTAMVCVFRPFPFLRHRLSFPQGPFQKAAVCFETITHHGQLISLRIAPADENFQRDRVCATGLFP